MEGIIQSIYNIVWSPALIVLLLGAGLYFTIRTKGVQIRLVPEMLRLLFGKLHSGKNSAGISQFEALCLSLSGRVGTGNIVGVATAIAFGGPGAIFWMWFIAFIGASTAFVEATLAQKYKILHNGYYSGGPFNYIEFALKQRWLAIIFALLCITGNGTLIVSVQTNSITAAFQNSFNISPILTVAGIAVLLFLVIVGGVKRIAKFASIVTPFMAIGYLCFSLFIIGMYWREIPDTFVLIFKSAFGFGSVFGGLIGSAIAFGVKRGLFSNEAGQGSGAIVAASADVEHPAQQGLTQSFSVYIDTLLVCTSTALMILCTGNYNVFDSAGNVIVENAPELGANYVAFTQAAIDSVWKGVGSGFVAIALAFFAFTTTLAYYFYAESSIFYLFKTNQKTHDSQCNGRRKHESATITIYRCVYFGMVILGAVMTADSVWTIGDIGVGLTTWLNVIVLLILSPKAIACLKEYETQRRLNS